MKKSIVIVVLILFSVTFGMLLQHKLSYDFATLEGETFKYEDLHGQWVIVNYFAEWCAPCLREIPELNEFARLTTGRDVQLYGVSFDAMQDHELQIIADKYNIEYPLIKQIVTPMPFDLPQYLPATFVIRPDGTVAGQLLGEQTAKGLMQAIELSPPAPF